MRSSRRAVWYQRRPGESRRLRIGLLEERTETRGLPSGPGEPRMGTRGFRPDKAGTVPVFAVRGTVPADSGPDIAVRATVPASCMLVATTLRGQFKETTVTKNLRSWSCAAALALLSPLALSAQVLIQVKDIESGEIIGSIRPGGSFTIYEGDEVRLIMSVGG